MDGGWSHPGWWARESVVIALDAKTGYPLALKHLIRGRNYEGTSKAMEGKSAEKIAEELKTCGYIITKLIHDKDASTMKHFRKVFPNVEKHLCTSNKLILFCIFTNSRSWRQIFEKKIVRTWKKISRNG